jgi:hypothetical protein
VPSTLMVMVSPEDVLTSTGGMMYIVSKVRMERMMRCSHLPALCLLLTKDGCITPVPLFPDNQQIHFHDEI